MSDQKLLSDESLEKNYSEKGFFHVWLKSYYTANNIVLHSIFLIVSVVAVIFFEVRLPFGFRQYIGTFSDIFLTYSSTIIGFLLVSFSILLSISNVRNTFSYFVNENKIYKKPLLKVILDHFIFPIGIFLILLILSLMLKVFSAVSFLPIIDITVKIYLFKGLTFTYILLLMLSVSELISYFFNMYKFIVITSHTISKEHEEEILKKIYVDHEKIDMLHLEDAKAIVAFAEKQKKAP